MKIDNHHNNQPAVHRPEGSQPLHAAGKNQASEKSKRQDHAELSEQARLLAQAHSAIDEIPADAQREQRVQQLRSQIESGTYTVPVRDLARKLAQRISTQPPAQE